MKDHYDFGKGKRGAVLPTPGKERITIRLDADILEYFREAVDRAGGGNYQTAINAVLREYLEGKKAAPQIEEIVRRVIREELRKASLRRIREWRILALKTKRPCPMDRPSFFFSFEPVFLRDHWSPHVAGVRTGAARVCKNLL